jgi:hypothetical protein
LNEQAFQGRILLSLDFDILSARAKLTLDCNRERSRQQGKVVKRPIR